MEDQRLERIKSRQGTQQGDPIGMFQYCCGQTRIMNETREYMELLAQQLYPDNTSEHMLARHHAREWMLAAFVDDLTIVAPPKVAARVYCRYAYLNHLYNKSVFKGAKNVAFSMGLSAEEVKVRLHEKFQALRHPPPTPHLFSTSYASAREAEDRITKDYPTDYCTDDDGNRICYSLLVEKEDTWEFQLRKKIRTGSPTC